MERFDQTKAVLTAETQVELREPHAQAVQELLEPEDSQLRKPNVIGLAIGVKETAGVPTGEPALVVLVTHKVAPDELRPEERVPPTLQKVKTDVIERASLSLRRCFPPRFQGLLGFPWVSLPRAGSGRID